MLRNSQISKLPEGTHSDGRGLYLSIRKGSRSWLYRYQIKGRRRAMGLGSYPTVSLADARRKRDDAEHQVKVEGIDPLEQPKATEAKADVLTVRAVVERTFEARKGDLKGDGKPGKWMSPFTSFILPAIGDRPIQNIHQTDLYDVFKPVWKASPDAAKKGMQRCAIVWRYAAAMGVEIDTSVPAKAKELLGSQNHTVQHIPSMPWSDIPAFYKSLGDTAGDRALKLLILTASRSGPIRHAHSDQIDRDAAVWTVPADLMKGLKGKTSDFRIPLGQEALRLTDGDGLLFPGRGGKVMSDMSLTAVLRRRQLSYRPHGFRASFKDWANETEVDWLVSESALAHQVGNKVARAYQRSDLLDRRRELAEKWEAFVLARKKV